MSEKTELHDHFNIFLKSRKLLYTRRNWNNKYNQRDDGFPDYSIPINNGRTLYIEFKTTEKFKTKYNGLKLNQIKWKVYLEHNGHKYLVTDNLEIAINFVNINIDGIENLSGKK